MNNEVSNRRGIAGLILMTVPIVSILIVGIGYAVLFSYGEVGIAAAGPRVTMDYQACAEARTVVEARVAAMGLPEVAFDDTADGFRVTARLPSEARVVRRIPNTLALPGTFAVHGVTSEGALGPVVVDESGIDYATVYMAFLDTPRAHIKLKAPAAITLREHQEQDVNGRVALFVNGDKVSEVYNLQAFTDGEIDLDLADASDLDRMDFAAETAIVLQDGPLPCDVTLRGVETLEASP